LYNAASDATKNELFMRACGAPLNRENVKLSEVYADGWRLIHTIHASNQHAPLNVHLFFFER
ncbi:MAG: hypothetical protein N2055_03235, partial [Tepidimonas taiwanensis]|nr:hypothetical protein [Tepidimonas taiwanensis]